MWQEPLHFGDGRGFLFGLDLCGDILLSDILEIHWFHFDQIFLGPIQAGSESEGWEAAQKKRGRAPLFFYSNSFILSFLHFSATSLSIFSVFLSLSLKDGSRLVECFFVISSPSSEMPLVLLPSHSCLRQI